MDWYFWITFLVISVISGVWASKARTQLTCRACSKTFNRPLVERQGVCPTCGVRWSRPGGAT